MTAGLSYRLFGLQIESELELPELERCAPVSDTAPDIVIRLSNVDPGADGVILRFDDAGAFQVDGGQSIKVEPCDEAPPQNVRLYLLGSAMGLLLHQRGLFPLHANAIEMGSGIVACAGPPGAGKSTLAAWLHDQGYRIWSDDVSVIEVPEGHPPICQPGLPRLRLWSDALIASGRHEADHPLSFAGDPTYRKFDVRVNPDRAGAAPLPLSAIYLLEKGDKIGIEPLEGRAKVKALFDNSYRGAQIRDHGDSAGHWKTCLAIAEAVPMFVFRRPLDRTAMGASVTFFLEHVTEQGRARESRSA